jgi:DNA repair protein RadC
VAPGPKETDRRAGYLLQLLRYPDSQLEPEDLLYLLLGRLAPGEAAARCVAALLQRFGSLGKLLAAPWPKLESFPAPVEGLAALLKTVQAINACVLREPYLQRPVIENMAGLREYLMATCGCGAVEMTRILFLDARFFLIRDEVHGQGTIDHAPLYPREVVQRVLDLGAKYAILVHNHPSGDPTPTEADLEATEELAAALRGVKASLVDHVIVTGTRAVSFRKEGWL